MTRVRRSRHDLVSTRRTPRIKREDAAVDEERVGGYSVAHLFCGADLSRTL